MSQDIAANLNTSQQSNKLIAKNTLMLYFRMILTMLVSLYTSRVVLNTLGVEDYGIFNVVGGVIVMFSFFNSAMASSTQRFLAFEIGRNDFYQLRKTFNATLIIHICIAILIFILAETIGLWFINTYLNIPGQRMDAARWIYHFSVLSFMLSVLQVPFNSSIVAHEKMNVYAYISILDVSLKLLIVFLLTWISFDKLKLYAILIFTVSIIIAFIFIIYTRVYFTETKFQVVKDKVLYKKLINYSGWSLFGNISDVATGQGVNLLLNIVFGPHINAARGIAFQVNTALMGFVTNFQMAMNPQIIKYYATNQISNMYQLVFQGAKYSYFLLFFFCFPIILETETILKLWLNIVPDYAIIFVQLVLINSLIDSLSGTIMTAVNATGRIKIYQIVISSIKLLNLPLSYVFLKLNYAPEIVFLISIIISIIALLVRIYLAKLIVQFSIKDFIFNVLLPISIITFGSCVIPLLMQFLINPGINRFMIVLLTSILSTFSLIYFFGITKQEKIKLNYVVKEKIFKSKKNDNMV